MGNMVVNHLM